MLNSGVSSAILILCIVTALLTISYIAGVSELDDYGDEDDRF